MRVYLTGFMGAGKTTVGRCLAREIDVPFVDLDREIEQRTGFSVAEIFERRGEAGFRRLEREVLRETAKLDDVVVATGGGTLSIPDNVRFVREHGVSVWLRPRWSTVVSRLESPAGPTRPLFQSPEQAQALYRSRLAGYRASDHQIGVGPAEDPEAVAARLRLLLEEASCAT